MKHSCHALLRLLEKDHQACGIRKKMRKKNDCMSVFSSEYHSLIQHISSSIRPTILTRLNLQIKKMTATEEFLQEPIPLSNELIG